MKKERSKPSNENQLNSTSGEDVDLLKNGILHI